MSKSVRRCLFAVPPLIVLCIDLLLYPAFFEGYQNNRGAEIVPLLAQEDVQLGTFRAHRIHVSLDDDIQDPNYLARIKTDTNALVMSVYVDTDGAVVRAGLAEAILEKLKSLSPRDFRDITDRLSQPRAVHSSSVAVFELHTPNSNSKQLPLKYLLVVPLRYSKPDDTRGDLAIAFPQVFAIAQERRISTLVVPCLGTNPWNKNAITFDEFFSAFFESVSTGTTPRNIYISFYTEWPSFYLEYAVSSLNANWHRYFEGAYANLPTIYRRKFREIFVFLFLCLFVMSFSVRPTLKAFCIICVTFCSSAIAAGSVIDLFAQGRSPAGAWLAEIVIFTILAVGLRYFVLWQAKDIFK